MLSTSILICILRHFRCELFNDTVNGDHIYFLKIYSRDSFSETRDYVVSAISEYDYLTLKEIFKNENA